LRGIRLIEPGCTITCTATTRRVRAAG